MAERFRPYDDDQARAAIDIRQRFAAFQDARKRAAGYRGSMVWVRRGATDYLIRAAYEGTGGVRRQKSLGPRSPATEKLKADFDRGRLEAEDRLKSLETGLARLAAVNAALGLGRIPVMAARVIRAVDDAGLLGRKIRIAGTNALFAYEAVGSVLFDGGLTSTEDVDLLFHARAGLRFTVHEDLREAPLMAILKKVDRSFDRARDAFRAFNKTGFYVDLIKPVPKPPWRKEAETVGPDPNDLIAAGVEGLFWLENAPPFEGVALDLNGAPVRLVTVDPRAFAIHKLWLSQQIRRDPMKRTRDLGQAHAVAELVATRLPHLTFDPTALKMLPRDLVDAATPLFAGHEPRPIDW